MSWRGLRISVCIAICILGSAKEAVSLKCDTAGLCRCSVNVDGSIIADCSKLGLNNVPHFENNVTVINLSNNRISSFPTSTEFPSTVTSLIFSFNRLTKFGQKPFQRILGLINLNLDGNLLDYTKDIFKPDIFTELKHIQMLRLKLNAKMESLKSSYPKVIANLISLKALYLDGLRSFTFTSGFKKLKMLQTLDLSGMNGNGRCNIEHLTSNYFTNLPYLVNVNLAGCNLRKIEQKTFTLLPLMQYLNLSNNMRLTFKVAANLTKDLQYTNIRTLDVSKVHCVYGIGTSLYIEDVKYLRNTSLSKIYLDSNRLTMLETGLFYYMPPTLQYVSYNDNNPTLGFYLLQLALLKNVKYFIGNHQYRIHDPRNVISRFEHCNDWRGPPSSNSTVNEMLPFLDKNTSLIQNVEDTTSSGIKQMTVSAMQFENSQRSTHSYNKVSVLNDPLVKYRGNALTNSTILNGKNSCNVTGLEFIITLPPNMEYCSFTDCNVQLEIPCFHISENNRLKTVILRRNGFQKLTGPILNLNHVEHIDLSSNSCWNISVDGAPNIKVLDIQNNLLGILFKDDGSQVFKNLKCLHEINLSNNKIESFPNDLFLYQEKLQLLNLSSNKIFGLNFRIDLMQQLQILDLSNNDLSSLNREIRNNISKIAKNRNLSINLTGNRLKCACDTLEFLEWFLNNRQFFMNYQNYTCYLQNGTVVGFDWLDVPLKQLRLTCKSIFGLILSVVVTIVLSISCVICGLVYRFRWKLRYLYYMTKNKYLDKTGEHICGDDQNNYRYHAFVSYAEEDHDFVREEVLEKLENHRGLNLCLHTRDFVPGSNITGNILNGIKDSRKLVVVLTENYLKSSWCMFEFNMARMESIYSRNGSNMILIIFLQKIPARELPLDILALVESKSYAEYSFDTEANLMFWNNVSEALSR